MQTIPNLDISAMGRSDNAAAWGGLWVINQVGGSSIDLFTLCVAQAKQIKAKSKLFTHYQPTPSWGRRAWLLRDSASPCTPNYLLLILPLREMLRFVSTL